MDAETAERIDELERRLEAYHARLEEAVAERDRLALDAAWGVHLSLYATLALIGLYCLVGRFLPPLGWLGGVTLGIAAIVTYVVVHGWSNGARMKEVDRLSALPEWQRRFD